MIIPASSRDARASSRTRVVVLEARDLVSGHRLYYGRYPKVVVVDLKMGAQDLGGPSLIRRMRLRDTWTQTLVFSGDVHA